MRLCIRAHTCFPESEAFASLSTVTPETLMSVLALIFKGIAFVLLNQKPLIKSLDGILNGSKIGHIILDLVLVFPLD